MQPLIVTFTIDQPDNILERGAVLTDAQAAVKTFETFMRDKKHKVAVTTAEAARERKPRTVHEVAERVYADEPAVSRDGAASLS